jgi:hypothetical protein
VPRPLVITLDEKGACPPRKLLARSRRKGREVPVIRRLPENSWKTWRGCNACQLQNDIPCVEAQVNHDWTAILAANGPRVWRTVYRVLNHHTDAEDCFQDTFLTAWRFARDHPVTEWAPYLTWLATHKAIDRLR